MNPDGFQARLDLMARNDINRRTRERVRAGIVLVVLAIGAIPLRPVAWQAVAGGADTVYLADIADLPLAPGLTEQMDEALVFDKPDGRIIEATARGAVTRGSVTGFYRDVLPALGWRLAGQTEGGRSMELMFDREDERITITAEDDPERDSLITVRFELSPH